MFVRQGPLLHALGRQKKPTWEELSGTDVRVDRAHNCKPVSRQGLCVASKVTNRGAIAGIRAVLAAHAAHLDLNKLSKQARSQGRHLR